MRAFVQRTRPWLVAGGAVLALVGSYLFWTMRVVRVGGVPLAGRLADFGFGGPRIYVALVALIAAVQAVLAGRSLRNGAVPVSRWVGLGRLGLALAAVPLLWAFTLVFFDDQPVDVIGPGPVLVLAGGLVVGLLSRAAARSGELTEGPQPWPRRSAATDVGLVLGSMALVFVAFLCGVGTVSNTPPLSLLTPLAATDASSFIGYLGAAMGLATWLSAMGVLAGLAGPFSRHPRLAWVAFAVLIAVFPITQQGGTFWVRVGAQAGVAVIAALGLNIVVGSAGLLDLGYVAFVAIGAYVAALTGSALLTNVNVPLPFLIVLFVVAPIVAAVFGVLLGAPTLRLRGDYLAIVTLGFGEIVRIVLNNVDWLTRGPNGISSIPDPGLGDWHMQKGLTVLGYTVPGDAVYLYLAAIVIAIVVTAIRRVNDSRIGRAWVAIREDEVAAAAMGINTTSIKLLAFASGAYFAGMGGAITAHLGTQVSPDSYTFEVSVLILAMVVLGGIGNPAGAAIGAVILTFLPEKLRDFSDVRFLLFGLALVLVMRFRPEGLLPSARRRAELRASGDEAAAESTGLVEVRGE